MFRNIVGTSSGKRLTAVVAGAALLVGMGGVGGAIAGALVTSSQIKDDTILSRDVHDGTLKQKDVKPSAVAGFRELSGYEIIHKAWWVDQDSDLARSQFGLYCPPGNGNHPSAGTSKAVVGGYYSVTPQLGKPYNASEYRVSVKSVGPPGVYPPPGGRHGGSYTVLAYNLSSSSMRLDVWVVCADASSGTYTELGGPETEG